MITDFRPMSSDFKIVALVSVLCAVLTGCGPANPVASTNADTAQTDAPIDVVVATVDGTEIYQSDVRRAAIAGGQIGMNETLDLTGPIFISTVNELIDQRLLALDSERVGAAQDAEAQRRLAAVRERIIGNYRVEAYLKEVVTDDAILELYQAQRDMAGRGEERRVRQIVVDDQATANIVAQRLSDEESFEDLVTEYSTDAATRAQDGELGWVSRDMLGGTLRTAVFNAQLGGRAGPIEVGGEWILVEVLDTRTPSNRSFEEVREDISRFLTFRAVDDLMTRLRDDGDIDRLYEDMKETQEPETSNDNPDTSDTNEGTTNP